MDQSEFSVAGATGNSNALVTVKSAVPFLLASPPVSSHLFLLTPVSLRCERTLSTDQKRTASSLYSRPLTLVAPTSLATYCVFTVSQPAHPPKLRFFYGLFTHSCFWVYTVDAFLFCFRLTSTESGVSNATELGTGPEITDLVGRLQEAINRATSMPLVTCTGPPKDSSPHPAQNSEVFDNDIAEMQDIARVRYLKGLLEFESGSRKGI